MDKKDGGTIDLESLRGFTPGPWRLSGVDVVNGDDHWCINGHALVEGFHSPTDCRLATVYTIEANARLIAAAPSMHAALTARRSRDAEVEALVAACRLARSYMSEAIEYETPCAKRDGATVDAALAPFTGAKP